MSDMNDNGDLSQLDTEGLQSFGCQAFLDEDDQRFALYRAELFLRSEDKS